VFHDDSIPKASLQREVHRCMDAEHEHQSKPDTSDTDKQVLPPSSESIRHFGGPDTEIQTAKIGTNETQHKSQFFEKPEKVGIDRYFELLLTCVLFTSHGVKSRLPEIVRSLVPLNSVKSSLPLGELMTPLTASLKVPPTLTWE
jgi:hypothetical protein